MSSKRLIFFVLISLLLVGVPLENAEKPTVFQTENISSVGENLEDYDLYLDYVDKNNVITTMQPGNNEETASLFGNGIEFQSDEMTSDLIVKGKSNCEVKVVVYLKWRASQNTSTAEASFKLYSGSEVVRQKTIDLGDPQDASPFGGGGSWQPYTVSLDVGCDGFTVSNGDRLSLDLEATASCEGGDQGGLFGGTCEVEMAYGGTVGNDYSRI